MKHLLYIILIGVTLAGCGGREYAEMQKRLQRLDEYNKADSTFYNTTEAEILVNYFGDHGTPNEKMLAYYLLGRAYYDIHEAPMALNCFQTAVEKADTTSEECNYRQLSRVYGQMSNIFYYQGLYKQEMKCEDLSTYYGFKGKDTLNALLNMAGKISAYKRLMQKDSAIITCHHVIELLDKSGYTQEAAGYCSSVMRELVDNGDYSLARQYMNRYEKESGYFDNNNNIEKGRESYYYTKGYYYLSIHVFDSAEYFFRKELKEGKDFNNQNAGSRGLAKLFQQKHMGDSAAKYALYSYEMNDSAYAHMATKEVEQMQGMYDYSRNQEIARLEKERADKEQNKVHFILFIMGVTIFVIVYITRIVYKKRKAEKRAYVQKVSDLAKAQIEITKLRSIAEHTEQLNMLIDEKESQIAEMTHDIESYKERLGSQKKNAESSLEESDVYKYMQRQALKAIVLSDDDWHKINVLAIEVLPNFYGFISSKKFELNDKEFKTCILVRMHFSPKDIANMLGVTQPYITKIRNNMMPKLFGIEGNSKDLDNRIMQFT